MSAEEAETKHKVKGTISEEAVIAMAWRNMFVSSCNSHKLAILRGIVAQCDTEMLAEAIELEMITSDIDSLRRRLWRSAS